MSWILRTHFILITWQKRDGDPVQICHKAMNMWKRKSLTEILTLDPIRIIPTKLCITSSTNSEPKPRDTRFGARCLSLFHDPWSPPRPGLSTMMKLWNSCLQFWHGHINVWYKLDKKSALFNYEPFIGRCLYGQQLPSLHQLVATLSTKLLGCERLINVYHG